MPFPAALTWMLMRMTFDLPRVLQWAFMRRTRSDRGMSSVSGTRSWALWPRSVRSATMRVAISRL